MRRAGGRAGGHLTCVSSCPCPFHAGITGERSIYKRRGEQPPEMGAFQELPKRMHFVFDLSASMTRFNGHDGRLDRSMEAATMIMESFKNFDHKFKYRISGHSGKRRGRG